MNKEKKTLYLLDAMALIYRAYYAFAKNPRINSKGVNTSATFGFANTLLELLRKEKPQYLGVVFDTKVPTFRHIEYKEYKAHREKMPEDLASAIPTIKKLLKALNIPVIEKDGYEADDVIGTLAKKAEKEELTTYMVTPDKDFGQLVSENIFMLKPARGGKAAEIIGIKEVTEKWELQNPEQFIDILGLWGDAADNIPGIPGIGEKRAKELIKEYGSIENLLKNTDKLKGKMKENVINYGEQGLLSKGLATIMVTVPITLELSKLELSAPNYSELRVLLDELEFNRLGTNIIEYYRQNFSETQGDFFLEAPMEVEDEEEETSIEKVEVIYSLIKNKKERSELIAKLSNEKSFCFDTETTNIDPNKAELVGISFSWKAGEAYYVTMPENYEDTLQIIKEFKEVLENPNIIKVGQNLKYDMDVLYWYEIQVRGKIFDTMVAHYLIRPEAKHSLDVLAKHYLNYDTVEYKSLFDAKDKVKDIRKVDLELLKDYACEDADITWRLKEKLEEELIEFGVDKVFEEIETPLIPVLTCMENTGVRIDENFLLDLSEELEGDISTLTKKIYEYAEEEFNVASPKQLGIILFEKLKVTDKPKLTKTKQYSTGEAEMQKLKSKHPIVEVILEYRGLAKLKSTYLDALPKLINPRTNKIHTSYNQAVVATGRLSSNNPNLQNIPIRTEQGRKVRKAFIPSDKDHVLLAADYSQIELRIFASMSREPNMMEAFRQGVDIHTATAARVFGVEIAEVSREQRSKAKMVNFGIIYGISAFGLAERLSISRTEAKEIMTQYFEKYPGIKDFMQQLIDFAKANEFVETIHKRRRYLRDINSGNGMMRSFAERNAINAPVQGSAADMIKIAMVRVHQELIDKNLKSRMIMQVHDELVLDVLKTEQEEVKEIVERCMVEAMPLEVPVEVDMKFGVDWLEAH